MTAERPKRSAVRRRGVATLRPDPLTFIAANTRLLPVPGLPAIRLYTAHEATGLWRLAEPGPDGAEPPPPYWAFPWGGGMALARFIGERPETVKGRQVLDLGSGSGLVGIAAMLAGAASLTAADIDPFALAATILNAAANGVAATVLGGDITGGEPPAADLVLAGDVFYEAAVAARMLPFLDRCLASGAAVLIGDPGRTYLPRARLRLLAEYPVPDIGKVEGATRRPSGVYALEPE